MKTIFQKKLIAAGIVAASAMSATAASAALDLATTTLNTSDVETIMGKIVVALAVLWGFRKIIKVTNRS